MDILEYLEADLDALRSLIIELKIADEDSQQEADAFTALVSLVKAQADAQTAVLGPLGANYPKLASVIQRSLKRMTAARDVEETIECCSNKSTWRASVNVYCELLETQMKQETRELLPSLHDELESSERRKLGTRYKHLRGFGSSHQRNWLKLWASVINQAG